MDTETFFLSILNFSLLIITNMEKLDMLLCWWLKRIHMAKTFMIWSLCEAIEENFFSSSCSNQEIFYIMHILSYFKTMKIYWSIIFIHILDSQKEISNLGKARDSKCCLLHKSVEYGTIKNIFPHLGTQKFIFNLLHRL